jgi:hypothetical protein
MTISTSGFKVNYFSGAYKERFGDNFLLQALDIFNDKTSPLLKWSWMNSTRICNPLLPALTATRPRLM